MTTISISTATLRQIARAEAGRPIQIFTFSTMPEIALDGWNPNACSGDDYQTPRAAALYEALGVPASDEEYALSEHTDGRWALIGLTTSGHRFAAEID